MKYLKRFFSKSNSNDTNRIYLKQIQGDLEDIFINLVDLGATVHYSDCDETETVLVIVRYPQVGGLSNFHAIDEELKNVMSQIEGLGFFAKIMIPTRWGTMNSYCEIDIGEGNGKTRKDKPISSRHRKARKK